VIKAIFICFIIDRSDLLLTLVLSHVTIIKITIFCGGQGLNPEPYIYNALSIPTELNLQGRQNYHLKSV